MAPSEIPEPKICLLPLAEPAPDKPKRKAPQPMGDGSAKWREDKHLWQVSVPVRGKRVYRYSKLQADAMIKLTELKKAVREGRPASAGRQTLKFYLEGWIEVHGPTLDSGSGGDLRRRHLPDQRHPGTQATGSPHRGGHRADLRPLRPTLSPDTMRTHCAVIHKALASPMARKGLPVNVADLASKPPSRGLTGRPSPQPGRDGALPGHPNRPAPRAMGGFGRDRDAQGGGIGVAMDRRRPGCPYGDHPAPGQAGEGEMDRASVVEDGWLGPYHQDLPRGVAWLWRITSGGWRERRRGGEARPGAGTSQHRGPFHRHGQPVPSASPPLTPTHLHHPAAERGPGEEGRPDPRPHRHPDHPADVRPRSEPGRRDR